VGAAGCAHRQIVPSEYTFGWNTSEVKRTRGGLSCARSTPAHRFRRQAVQPRPPMFRLLGLPGWPPQTRDTKGLWRLTACSGALEQQALPPPMVSTAHSPQRLFARASLARGLGVADSPVRAESAPGRRAPHRVVLSECNPARHPHACFSLSSLKHRLQLDRTWCSVGGRVAPRPARTGAQSQQARAPQAEHAALPHRLVRAQHRRVPDHEVLVAVGARAASATERPAPWNK